MKRLPIVPALAILGLSTAPLFPTYPQTIHTVIPHQVMAAPVMQEQATQTASVTSEYVEPTPKPTPVPTIAAKPVTGSKTDWMTAAGIPQSDWQYVDFIVTRESGWNPNAVNKSSGACSLAQALPCSKIPGDWRDPVNALRWQHSYVKARYGSYYGAYQFWLANSWY
jgi:hypothetical protein